MSKTHDIIEFRGGATSKKQEKTRILGLFEKQKRKAFTLSEVLITLAIIGIVAVLTIPNLINRYQEHVTVQQVKQHYKMLQDAYKRMEYEEGSYMDIMAPQPGDGATGVLLRIMDKYVNKLDLKTNCYNRNSPCMICSNLTLLNGNAGDALCAGSTRGRALLKNGTVIVVFGDSLWGETSGNMLVPIRIYLDGNKKNRVFGKTAFDFYITKDGIVPQRIAKGTNHNGKMSGTGSDCAAWVIYKGNMDYLRRTVSWDE